jgi:predicted MPP superfamily phosphohydrolase
MSLRSAIARLRGSLSRPAGKATGVALSVTALWALDYLVLQPLREREILDASAALVHVICTMAALPALVVGRGVLYVKHHLPPEQVWIYLALVGVGAALFAWPVAFLFFRWRERERRRRELPEPGRRGFLRRSLTWASLGGCALLGGYTVLLEPRLPRVRRLRFPLRGLPPALSGLRLVQLTDLHLGPYNSAAYLGRCIRRANALAPDLVALTGDYIHGSPVYIAPLARILGGLRARHGVVAVLGNHDHWEDAGACRRALRRQGIRLLDNTRLWVSPEGLVPDPPRGGGLCLGGVGDYWEDRTDLEAALGGVPAELPRLLLSHNPDFAESAEARSGRHRVDLMLSGHTHGGQVRLPGVRSLIVPSSYGDRYARGLCRGPAFPVYVSAGLGVTIFPVRLLCPPEITLIELVTA